MKVNGQMPQLILKNNFFENRELETIETSFGKINRIREIGELGVKVAESFENINFNQIEEGFRLL